VHVIETRVPFRFGNVEMRRLPHLLLRLTLESNGKVATGVAADHLLAKWFTKNAAVTTEEETAQMIDVVDTARRIAESAPAAATPFDLWWEIYQEQHRHGKAKGWPPLLTSFGVTLIERAILDAYGALHGKPFGQLVREEGLGLDLSRIHAPLKRRRAAEFLPPSPLHRMALRHTVGLLDPLTAAEARAAGAPHDGLPVSLEEYIRVDGLSRFKIKITANFEKSVAQLRNLTPLLERETGGNYHCTLDGNESFRDLAEFRKFWDLLLSEGDLAPFLDRLIFVEQPLARDTAFRDDIRAAFRGCARPPRLIIDESDGELDSLPRALACGYDGTSHKNCKGVFKSLANLALLRHRGTPFIFSGEDLTNIGPIALPQDLCVAQNLGLEDVERNGHHYFAGLPDFSRPAWPSLLRTHSDLFRELAGGRVALRIENGFLDGGSLLRHGLGLEAAIGSALFSGKGF